MRGAHLSIHYFIGLTEKGSAFAMPEHHIAHEKIAQHRWTDLARERSRAFPMHVLRADLDVRCILERGVHGPDRGERRDDHDLDLARLAYLEKKRGDKRRGLALGHVHLPIRGDDFFSHGELLLKLKIDEGRVMRRDK